MKLRTLIFVALILVSVLPVGILAYWQNQAVSDNQFSVVENQHKVIARTLAIALERYATDLRSAFKLTVENLHHIHIVAGLQQHLSELYFKHIRSIDLDGNILLLQCGLACPQDPQFSKKVLLAINDTLLAARSNPEEIYFSPVTFNPGGQPAIYLVSRMADGNIAIGEVVPDYFIELQQTVAFGEKGHAAIVDQVGRVIAHPRKAWIKSIKDLSGVSVVQKMMNGENGVTQFYSPAVKADMVAGFNVVEGPGWGVMVPQPQSEIYLNAQRISKAAVTIALLGICVAAFLGWWISGIISRPMQLLAAAAQSVARGDLSAKVDLTDKLRPLEMEKLEHSFNQMIDDVGRKNTVLVNLAHEAVISNNHKSAFISSLNHELRTPMNAVLGFAQMLDINESEPLSENQKSAVEHILRNGNHLLELIDQMLELNEIEAGTLPLHMEDIPARDVLNESLYLIQARANQDNIEIIDDTGSESLPLLWTDSTRLIQVLLNLLTNAVKYNREGGSVSIACREVHGGMLRLSVIDNGLGIAAELQDKLFMPFERLGHELGQIDGTGIGLSITQQIVEKLGGHIGFESEQGQGSHFWVDIPLSSKTVDQGEQDDVVASEVVQAETGAADAVSHTLLYIEDNPDNLHLVEAIVDQYKNLRLISAPNSLIGFDLATSKKPALILMDINLPGMNGLQAMKRLRRTPETRLIPVIALTSNSMPQDIEAGLKAGFDGYLTKPIKVSELMQTIEQTIDDIIAPI
jgi:signal transduction histidine kinase/CheY-like chemotaxis protein